MTTKFSNVKVGDIVEIVLLDHAAKTHLDKPGALVFETFGRVMNVTSTSFEIQYWGLVGGTDIDNNTEITCVAKGAIKDLRQLVYRRRQ